jgi:hypothetical protein
VDRIASAWLIKRFVDPDARFKSVAPEGYVHQKGKLRFDMFEAEYTHERDPARSTRCCSASDCALPRSAPL